jgi:hypothetical protein
VASVDASSGSRCPACARYTGPEARFCPHCGAALLRPPAPAMSVPVPPSRPPRAEVVIVHGARPPAHRILRLLLTIWLVAYPVVACTPVLLGAATGGASGGWAVLGGWLAGSLLFGPWIIGIIVLGLLAMLTR